MDVPLEAGVLFPLFEGLPHVMYSLKSLDGRYLEVNQAFADRAGCKSALDVVGKRARDLFAPELALSYEAQDAELLTTRRTVRRQLELITRPDGRLGWYITNKSLVTKLNGDPIAIAAASVDEHVAAPSSRMGALGAAMEHIRTHFHQPITVTELAAIAGMTPGALERRMRRVVGLSPRQLVVRARVEEAMHLLVTTTRPLAEIAASCGFFDQAAMTRQTRRLIGITPGAARRAARPAGGPAAAVARRPAPR